MNAERGKGDAIPLLSFQDAPPFGRGEFTHPLPLMPVRPLAEEEIPLYQEGLGVCQGRSPL